MQRVIVFTAIVLSLILYLAPARRPAAKPKLDDDEYFTARNTVDAGQYANAQTAYQLQMATIYPFFQMALMGQWWVALMNTLFFALGIGLYRWLLPRFTKGAADLIDRRITVHQAIAELNGIPALRKIAASLTVIAFAGTAMFEIVWGARVLGITIGGDQFMYDLIVILLASYLVIFVWMGGQPATLKADQIQLLVAYVGLHVLVAWIAWQPGLNFAKLGLPLIVPLIVVASGGMLVWRLLMSRWRSSDNRMRLLNVFTMVSLVGMLLALTIGHHELGETLGWRLNADQATKAAADPQFLIALASVAILPLFFQFVDMTSWQRLAAVQEEQEQSLSERRRGLVQFLIESPLSWLLPIFMGLACAQVIVNPSDKDPWKALLIALMNGGSPASTLISSLVFSGIIAVFLSTASELLNGIGMAAGYDLVLSKATSSSEQNSDSPRLQRGRVAFAGATGGVVVLFLIAERIFPTGGDGVIGIFMAFYTPLVALAPALLIPILLNRRAHPAAVLLAVVGGASVGLACGFWSAVQPEALDGRIPWIGPILAFLIAWIGYFLGLLAGSPVTKGATVTEVVRG